MTETTPLSAPIMRVTLAAVANDRDAAAGEAGEIGVGVVVERGHRADS